MNARALDQAAAELRRKRQRALESGGLGLVAAMLAPLAWLVSQPLGVAVAIGAGVQALIVLVSLVSRRSQLEELAVEPSAYILPEVEEFGARLASPRQREILARGILSLLKDGFKPGVFYLPDRVVRYARELEAIARDLRSPNVRVQPTALARCRCLLTRAPDSPLYNPRLPVDDLGAWLYRIREGMTPVAPLAGAASRRAEPGSGAA